MDHVLGRAAEMDAAAAAFDGQRDGFTLDEARAAAAAVGISRHAMDAAMAELDAARSGATTPARPPAHALSLAEGVTAPVSGLVGVVYRLRLALLRLARGPGARDGADASLIPVHGTLDFVAAPAAVLEALGHLNDSWGTLAFHRAEGGHPLQGGTVVYRTTGNTGALHVLHASGVDELRVCLGPTTTASGDAGTRVDLIALLPRSVVSARAVSAVEAPWWTVVGGILGALMGVARWLLGAAPGAGIVPTIVVIAVLATVAGLAVTAYEGSIAPVRLARQMATIVLPTVRDRIEEQLRPPAHHWALNPTDRRARTATIPHADGRAPVP
jgi:hypothetical protein